MAIFLYNTLTRKKEEFKPVEQEKVKIYTCGVTVYDNAHIGHARSAFLFDVIRRYFKYKGFQTIFIRNITDIDDKIIKRAQEAVRKNPSLDISTAAKAIAEKYTQNFHQDMKDLYIDPPDIEPKATEHIGQMQALIKRLIDNSFAYVSGGDVYFRVRNFPQYGRLSRQSVENMQTGARIEQEENKEDPLDFVLWKNSKPAEPSWESPWGQGRPGWHIECSAMAMHYLGEHFDIHAGGLDLVFPHHENEIAQSEAATGRPFATYWLHNGMITIQGEKMSKSLGNIILIQDVLKKYPADALKIFFLQAHYSSPLDYSEAKIQEAVSSLERIRILFDRIDRLSQIKMGRRTMSPEDMDALIKEADGFTKDIEHCRVDFENAMDDDFNTARALSVIFDIIGKSNKLLDNPSIPSERKVSMCQCSKFFILHMGRVLGLFTSAEKIKYLPDEQVILQLIQCRNDARLQKDYQKADRIRKELYDKGISIEDTRDGTVWRRR